MFKMKNRASESESVLDSANLGRSKMSDKFNVAQQEMIVSGRNFPGLDQTDVAIETSLGR
jgi:hypothetical protein